MSYKGQTKGPCPGCAEGTHHPTGGVCHTCAGLLKDGAAYRAETARRLAHAAPAVWHWTERDYGWPTYYGDWEFTYDDGAKDALTGALVGLVAATSEPAPPGTPRVSAVPNPDRHARTYTPFLAWPKLLTVKGDWSWDTLVLMPAPVRAAIDALDQAIRAALTSTYTRGKRDGSSVLRQLASGEVTLDDFDDARLTRAERHAKRRH